MKYLIQVNSLGKERKIPIKFLAATENNFLKMYYVNYFESFAGLLKDGPDLIGELMKEKRIERKIIILFS